MKRFALLLCLVTISATNSTTAFGAIAGPGFWDAGPPDGVLDEFKDNSRAFLVDSDSNGVVSTGDIVYGVLQFHDKVQPTAGAITPPSIATVFSLTVGDNTGFFQGQPVFDLLPTTGIYSLDNLASTVAGTTNSADFQAAISAVSGTGAMFAVLSALNGADPSALTPTAAIAAVLGAGSVYKTDLIGGFEGLTPNALLGEFYQIKIEDLNFSQPSGTPIGSERAGLSVLWSSLGPTAQFLPVNTADFYDVNLPFTNNPLPANLASQADIYLSANVQAVNSGSGWFFQGNTNATLNAVVPEPASMLVWAGIGFAGAVGGVIRRRRR